MHDSLSTFGKRDCAQNRRSLICFAGERERLKIEVYELVKTLTRECGAAWNLPQIISSHLLTVAGSWECCVHLNVWPQANPRNIVWLFNSHVLIGVWKTQETFVSVNNYFSQCENWLWIKNKFDNTLCCLGIRDPIYKIWINAINCKGVTRC